MSIPAPLGFLVVKRGSTTPFTAEQHVDVYPVLPPDLYLQSLRHEQYRAEQAAHQAALADLWDQLDWCTDDAVTRAIIDLHGPDFDYPPHAVCGGCDSDGWESERPEWPCRTTQVIDNCRCVVAPIVDDGPDNSKLIHRWCCDPKVALCGYPLTKAWIDPNTKVTPDDCVVCLDMIDADVECSPGCFDRHEARS